MKLRRLAIALALPAMAALSATASPAATTRVFVDSRQTLGNSNTRAVALGDLDLDGDVDAFVANGDTGADLVWLGDGDGRFRDSGQRLGNGNGRSVALGDLDGDGDLDAYVG